MSDAVSGLPQGEPIRGTLMTAPTQCVVFDPERDLYFFWVKGRKGYVVAYPATEYDEHLQSARRAASSPEPREAE